MNSSNDTLEEVMGALRLRYLTDLTIVFSTCIFD